MGKLDCFQMAGVDLMSKTADMTVWAQDSFSDDIIPRSFRVFRKPDLGRVNSRDIFVLTSVPDLPVVTEFVRAANHRNPSSNPFCQGRPQCSVFTADAL